MIGKHRTRLGRGLAIVLLWGMGLLLAYPALRAEEEPKTVKVDEASKKEKIHLHSGQELRVTLNMQAGTGYFWKVDKNDDKVLRPQGKPLIKAPQKELVGAAQTVEFRFLAMQPGRSELIIHYERPFEKNAKPARTFRLKVEVE